jgi:hypothetical protein
MVQWIGGNDVSALVYDYKDCLIRRKGEIPGWQSRRLTLRPGFSIQTSRQ